MLRHYFFVYRHLSGAIVDFRCPAGGIIVTGWTKLAVLQAAWEKASRRFPTKPWEVLLIIQAKTKEEQRQVQLLERDWEHAYLDFEALMTVR